MNVKKEMDVPIVLSVITVNTVFLLMVNRLVQDAHGDIVDATSAVTIKYSKYTY
jgi:hypothetical protein